MRVCVCARVGIRLLKIFTWKFSELQILELDAKPKPWIFDAHHRNNKQITLQRWKNQSNNNNNSKNNPKTRNHLSMRNARRKYYSLTFQIVLCARCSMCASPLGWTMVLFFSFSFSFAPKIREREKNCPNALWYSLTCNMCIVHAEIAISCTFFLFAF